MTNLSQFHPPLHRRYNWFLVARQWRIVRKAKLLLLALLVGVIVRLGEGWMNEYLAHTDTAHTHLSLKADVFRLANFGAQGWTRDDWTEGTVDFKLRREKK